MTIPPTISTACIKSRSWHSVQPFINSRVANITYPPVCVSAMMEFNMAAITATSSGSCGIPWPLKWRVSNKQNVSTCLSFGVIAESRSKMAAILNFKMAATMGREYVGGIFSISPWVGLPLCKVSCLLQKLNDSGAFPLYYKRHSKASFSQFFSCVVLCWLYCLLSILHDPLSYSAAQTLFTELNELKAAQFLT